MRAFRRFERIVCLFPSPPCFVCTPLPLCVCSLVSLLSISPPHSLMFFVFLSFCGGSGVREPFTLFRRNRVHHSFPSCRFYHPSVVCARLSLCPCLSLPKIHRIYYSFLVCFACCRAFFLRTGTARSHPSRAARSPKRAPSLPGFLYYFKHIYIQRSDNKPQWYTKYIRRISTWNQESRKEESVCSPCVIGAKPFGVFPIFFSVFMFFSLHVFRSSVEVAAALPEHPWLSSAAGRRLPPPPPSSSSRVSVRALWHSSACEVCAYRRRALGYVSPSHSLEG